MPERSSKPHLSLNKVLSKNNSRKHYDHTIGKKKKFYAKTKTYRTFQRTRVHDAASSNASSMYSDRVDALLEETAALEEEERVLMGRGEARKKQPKKKSKKKDNGKDNKTQEERASEYKQRKDKIKRDIARRQGVTAKLNERNERGQPVLKHRVMSLLDKLRADAAASGNVDKSLGRNKRKTADVHSEGFSYPKTKKKKT